METGGKASEENARMGFGARRGRLEEADAARRERLVEEVRANDALMESQVFRRWLKGVADRCDYLGIFTQPPLGDFERGKIAAHRALVGGFVARSTKGAAWLSEYAAEKAAFLMKEEECRR